jgi:hypothetical protein
LILLYILKMSDYKTLERYRNSNIKIIAIEVLNSVLEQTTPDIKDYILNDYIEKLLVVYNIEQTIFDNAIHDLRNALEL